MAHDKLSGSLSMGVCAVVMQALDAHIPICRLSRQSNLPIFYAQRFFPTSIIQPGVAISIYISVRSVDHMEIGLFPKTVAPILMN